MKQPPPARFLPTSRTAPWLGVLLLAGLAWSLAGAGEEPKLDDDPLPLKRLAIPASRLAVEQERLQQGILVQLPLAEFEAQVRKAAQARKNAKLTPSLVRSTYAAKLEGNNLVKGTGTWMIHHPGSGSAVLSLPSLNLALSKVTSENGGSVVLGELDGKNLILVVDKPGTQTVFFDWSLRGTTTPGGLHFDLKLPPCALASLELKVPDDQVVSLSRSTALLTDSSEPENTGQKTWQLSLTGKAQVELDIRPLAGSAEVPAAQFSQLATKQEITPQLVKSDFDFQVEVLHHPVQEFLFDYDPTLQPYEVSVRNAEIQKWEWRPAPAPQSKTDKPLPSLFIRLREPFQGTLAGPRIRCLAAHAPDPLWTSPTMRLRHSLARAESLKLHIHPDVQLEKWDAGSFRLLSSVAANDGSQILNLVDPRITTATLGTDVPTTRRPSFLAKTQGQDLHIRQETWWHLGPAGAALDSVFSFDLARGNLHQLIVRLPKTGKKWLVETIDTDPPEFLQSWSATGPLLFVDLRQGLSPRLSAKLKIRLVSPWDAQASAAVLDFPDLEPAQASVREGVFHIGIDPMFQGSIVQNSLPPNNPQPANTRIGPLSGPPTFSFPFRDQMVTGKLRLLLNRSSLHAAMRTHVLLGPQSGTVATRLELEPLAGSLDHCDLLVAATSEQRWQVREEKPSDRLLRLERLPWRDNLPRLLALSQPLLPQPLPWLAGAAPDLLEPSQVWRLHFSPPLTQRGVLLLDTTMLPTRPDHWDLPILSLLETPRQEGEVLLETFGLDIRTHVASGLVPLKAPLAHAGRFHFVPPRVPRLLVQTAPSPTVPAAREQIDQAELVTQVLEDGRVFHHFSFQVAHWRKNDIPALLPHVQAKILAGKIDGRWLENIQRSDVRIGVEVLFPVTPHATRQRFDLYYSTDASWSAWPGWTSLEVPWPELPIQPLTRQRSWRLAPGLAPLGQEHWQNLSMPGGMETTSPDLVRQAWHFEEPLLHGWLLLQDNPQHDLHDAEASWRKKVSSDLTLGEALQQLLFDHLKDRAILVVDAGALAAAGLAPGTPLGPLPPGSTRPFWEHLGLVHVSCRAAPLLTTRTQLESWQRQFGFTTKNLDPGIVQALQTGRDRQGLFQTAAYWLRHTPSAQGHANVVGNLPPGLFAAQPPPGWTAWQTRPGQPEKTAMVVMRQPELRTCGILLALVTMVLVWNMRRFLTGVWCFRGFLAWIAAWAMAFIWLPVPVNHAAVGPLLTGLGLGLLDYAALLVRGSRSSSARNPSTQTMIRSASIIIPALLIAAAGFALPQAHSGGADPFTVLILQADNPKQAKALVSPDLVNRLKELAAHPLDNQTSSLLVAAQYHGQVKGNLVYFQAHFEIFNVSDKSMLHLPLTGVDLLEASYLDGAPAHPVPSDEPQGGYTLAIPGKGHHRLNLAFTARWHGLAEFHELRFGIPRLPQTLLQLKVPGGWHEVQVLSCQGDDKIEPAGSLQELRAHLGRESSVHVRWRPESAAVPVPAVDVQESYFWDLRPGFFALSGLLNYHVAKGSVQQLFLTIPDNAEVRSVELAGASFQGTRIKKWRLVGKENRQLQVELSNPLSGKFHLVLQLLPRVALDAAAVALRLPLPLKAKPHEGVLAYRLEGWDAIDKTQGLAIGTRLKAELAGKIWQAAGQREPGLPTRAFTFNRTVGPSQLLLTLQPAQPSAQQEIHLRAQPAFTDITARLQVKSAAADLSLVEWEVPAAVTLADVSGANVHHWSRQDPLVPGGAGEKGNSIIQIWLQQPAADVDLTLSGWMKNSLKPTSAKPGLLILPLLRPLNVRLGSSLVKVEAAPGLALEADKKMIGLNLQREAVPLTYGAAPVYAGAFLVRQAMLPSTARILTTVGRIGNPSYQNAMTFHAHVHCQLLRGDPQDVLVRLRHWPENDVHLEMFLPGVKATHSRDGADHIWRISVPGGRLQPVTLGLRGQRPLARDKFVMPEVEVQGAVDAGRWLVLDDPELQPAQAKGLIPIKVWAAEVPAWPDELSRAPHDTPAWKIKDAAWQLLLQPRLSHGALPWRILWGEHEIHERDAHWVHQASYLLTTRQAAVVPLVLPGGGRFLAASWGEDMLVPRRIAGQHIELSLTHSPGGQLLRVRWTLPKAKESPTAPSLASLQFPDADDTPLIPATLWLPAGFQPPREPLGPAGALLHRARGQMALASLLAERAQEQKVELPKVQILAAQKLLFHWLGHADYELLRAGKLKAEPQNLAVLRDTLNDLRRQNQKLAQQGRYDAQRLEADKAPNAPDPRLQVTALQLPEQGVPVSFAPSRVLDLRPESFQDLGYSVLVSQLLFVAFLVLLFVSSLPRFFRRLPQFWPEQLFAASLLGTLLFGISLLGVLLCLVGTIGRIAWLSFALVRLWNSFVVKREPAK